MTSPLHNLHNLVNPHTVSPSGYEGYDSQGDPTQSSPFHTTHVLEVNVSNQPFVSLVLKGLALAAGVAVVVLGILGTADAKANVTLLGIGLVCLSLWALQKGQ